MNSKARAALVAVVIVGLVVFAARVSGSSQTARRGLVTRSPNHYADRVGMDVSNDLFDYPSTQIDLELAQLRAGGISWVREDLSWDVAEPARGVFDWSRFDRLMTAASRTGIQVLGILDYSAPWASSDPSGHASKFYPPMSDNDFATYAAAIARRYGVGGAFWQANPGLRADPLTAVEIWNEPYGDWFWEPGPNPAAYAALVRATAPAIHAVDPSMTVLMSGDLRDWNGRTYPHEHPWLASLLRTAPGIARLVNGIDVHPYPSPWSRGPYQDAPHIETSFGRVQLIRAIELAAHVKLPIWITEVGWSTAPDTRLAVSRRAQATYLTEAIERALGSWGSYVAKFFVFGWYRSSGQPNDLAYNYGLLDRGGEPTPAWNAIAKLLGGRAGGPEPRAPLSN